MLWTGMDEENTTCMGEEFSKDKTNSEAKMAETPSTMSGTSSMMPGGIPRPIDRTPDEDEFQMTLIPETKIIFMGEDIGVKPITVNIILHNDTPWLQAFKVKCTANYMFKIYPSHGVIAPNEKKDIAITFKWKDVPKDDQHFISFYHVHVDDAIRDETPRQMLQKYRPEGVKRIQCQFKHADGTPVKKADQIAPGHGMVINPLTGKPEPAKKQ